MIVPKHGLLAAATLRNRVPELARVILARADGLPMYDDVSLAERDAGAAVTATILGLAGSAGVALGLGQEQAIVLSFEDGVLVLRSIAGRYVLAVVAPHQSDLRAVSEAVEDQARVLAALVDHSERVA